MDSKQVKLFNSKNQLVSNFEDEIEKILISVHGEKYYDVDEELENTNLIPIQYVSEKDEEELSKTIDVVDAMVDKKAKKIKIVDEKSTKKRVSFKDFIPALFFISMFAIIVFAGYYFLNNIDFGSFIK